MPEVDVVPIEVCSSKKQFLSLFSFNKVTGTHCHIRNLACDYYIDIEKYYMFMDLPGKKLEQFIFTVRKMRNKLCFLKILCLVFNIIFLLFF